MIKPGYRTSEFWFTVVSFIFSGLYLIGAIGDNSQKEDLIRDVSHGVESIILIGGQLAILWKYINSRKEIKKTWENNSNKNESDTEENHTARSKNNVNNKRKNQSRSRKTNKSSKTIAK
jgi:hypothetical protein